ATQSSLDRGFPPSPREAPRRQTRHRHHFSRPKPRFRPRGHGRPRHFPVAHRLRWPRLAKPPRPPLWHQRPPHHPPPRPKRHPPRHQRPQQLRIMDSKIAPGAELK
ncbi:MAG: hypothetical protein ACK53Y_26125, partial [bacterium]